VFLLFFLKRFFIFLKRFFPAVPFHLFIAFLNTAVWLNHFSKLASHVYVKKAPWIQRKIQKGCEAASAIADMRPLQGLLYLRQDLLLIFMAWME
jgi:hypothetical protein